MCHRFQTPTSSATGAAVDQPADHAPRADVDGEHVPPAPVDDEHVPPAPVDDEREPEQILDPILPRPPVTRIDPRPRGRRIHHPHLTGLFSLSSFASPLRAHQTAIFILTYLKCDLGIPCDEHGRPLPPNMPPLPRTTAQDDDWSPYANKTQFLLADFLYRKAQMSAGNVDELMEIWDGYMAPFESFSPYASAADLLGKVDATTVGDAPWNQLNVSFRGEAGPGSPSWMSDVYEVWYRDPLVVARNLLDNPDFASEFDYSPYVELGRDGKRRWSDFMSGNLAWRHSVSFPPLTN